MVKKLENQELTKEEYEFYRSHFKYQGAESVIYCQSGENIARKLFQDNFGNGIISQEEVEKIRTNKLEKIKCLNQYSLNNEVEIVKTLSYQNQFIGYDMTTNPQLVAMNDIAMSRKMKIVLLQQIKEKLEKWHEMDIVYGDLSQQNILINKKTGLPHFCDLDNIQVANLPIDLFESVLEPFKNPSGLIDKKVDSYMYNLLLMDMLDPYYDGYQELYQKIEYGYHPHYLMKEARPVLQKMCQAQAHGYYYGNYLTKYLKK